MYFRIIVFLFFFLCHGLFAMQAREQIAIASAKVEVSSGNRLLVLQAEDLGMAHSIDKASFEALEKGWVTSANVLVPGPWLPEVLRWSRNHLNADLGIQLDLNSDWSSFRWRPISNLSKDSGLIDDGGYLSSSDRSVARNAEPGKVEQEVRSQIELAKRAGMPISHLDQHMHVMYLSPKLFQAYWKMGQEYDVPVVVYNQLIKQWGTPSAKPGFYNFGGTEVDMAKVPVDNVLQIKPGWAQKDWLKAYENALSALPPGIYVLSVHLGFNDEELQAMTWDHPDWGAQWRQNDYDVISSPEFHKFLKDKGFTLVNWKDLQKMMAEHR